MPRWGSTPTSGPATSGFGDSGVCAADQTGTGIGPRPAKTATRWAAATAGSQSAASLGPASGKAVIGIGGWSGGDPAATPVEFRQ